MLERMNLFRCGSTFTPYDVPLSGFRTWSPKGDQSLLKELFGQNLSPESLKVPQLTWKHKKKCILCQFLAKNINQAIHFTISRTLIFKMPIIMKF